ncbi:MAG: GNAT family N-acetyltransferase [Oscillospiraceae bacterium]|nr:GNAT family N-acetyltransferase [Oscillospiraceae bacterium]
MICYRKATLEDLEILWNRSIAENPGDARYLRWKDSFISRNQQQEAATFVVVDGVLPVGEVTLDYYASGYGNAESRIKLADGKTTGYVTALRIREEYEGKGYVSQLMRCMEDGARALGFRRLTIGVEAAETRNLGIYLHWGYDAFVMSEIDDGALVLFYEKKL